MIPSLRYNILAIEREDETEKFDGMTLEKKAELEERQQDNEDNKLLIRTK